MRQKLCPPILVLALALGAWLVPSPAEAAFASVGTFCATNHKTSASSWSGSSTSNPLITTAQLNAGNLGVIVLATDNLVTTDGNTNTHTTITDAAGNTWTKAREATNGLGAAAAGVTVSIWYTKATFNLASGASITVNLSGAITAKAATCWQFTMGAGSIVVDGGADKLNDDGVVDAGSITLSGLQNIEHLWLRGTGGESSSVGTTYTASANYTTFFHGGSTQPNMSTTAGAASASNIGARGDFRIFTATSDITDPTYSAFSLDSVSTMVALSETAVPTQLAFSVQPSNAAATAAISPAIKVQVRDSGGNLVTSATNPITLAIQFNAGPGGTLSGTFANVVPVNGEATFSGISIDKIGTGYTLTASATGLTPAPPSTPFNITLGAAAKLAFTTSPSNSTGGVAFATQPVVTLQDAGGNTVTGTAQNVTLAIQNNAGPGGVLSGTTTVAVNTSTGQATFSGLSIDKAGTGYTLTATGSTVSTTPGVVVSGAFNITVGLASKLAYSVQPSNATTTVAISPAIKVQVQDAGGNLITSATNPITLAIGTNPGGGTLSGTFLNVAPLLGEATFSNISIDTAGTGYTLVASSGVLQSATSTSFRIFLASVKVGSFTKTTAVAPATQVVAHGLGVVPTAIILWTGDLNTEAFSVTPYFGFGFTDGTTSMSVSATSLDGVATSDASRRMANKALTIVRYGEVLIAEADLQSWDGTNFTLNWTTNDSFAGVVHFIAIGGGGVSAKVINWQMPVSPQPSTGCPATPGCSGVGFQPDVVIHAHIGSGFGTTPPASSPAAGFGLGVMDKNGGQWANTYFSSDAVVSSSVAKRTQQTDAAIYGFNTSTGATKKANFVSMDADGFTVNFTIFSNATNSQVISLALKGVNAKAGSFLKSTGAQPASQPITGVGFTPSVVLLSSVQDVAEALAPNPPVAHGRFGLGASDGITQGSFATADLDATTPTKVQGIDKTSKVFVKVNNSTPAIDAEANLTSLDSNGFTLNWTTNDAVGTEILYLAIGGGAPALNNFLVEAAGGGPIGAQTVGTPFNIKITARDASNNPLTGFTGTVDLSSTGTLSAGGGTTATFTNGVLTSYSVTISSVGSFTLTATKTGGGPVGTSTAFNSACGSVTDAGYMAVSATSTGATVYWSSANPVVILRKSGGSTDTPVGGTTYSAGNPLGTSTVVYSGSVAEKSVLDTVAGRSLTDRYKVFAKGVGSCYAPGLQVDASVPAGTGWSYAMASPSGNSMLKPGIAGTSTIYIGGNGSKITSLSTADGTQSWDPVSSTGAIQGWLTWLPVGSGGVKSVQSGTTTLAIGSGTAAETVNVTLATPLTNLNRSVLFFSVRGSSNEPGDSQVRGQLTSTTNLQFYRGDANSLSPMTIQWYVVEFRSGVWVQRGTLNFADTGTQTVSAVDPNKSFVLLSCSVQTSDATYGPDDYFRAQLLNSTTLEISLPPTGDPRTCDWQVVEYQNASVQRGTGTLGTTVASSGAINISPVDTTKSFVQVTWMSTDAASATGPNFLRAQLTSATTIQIDRGATGTTINYAWEVVSFKDGTTVQSGNRTFGTADTSLTAPISVDPTRSVAFLSGYQRVGSHPYTADDQVGPGWFTATITDSTTLTLQRQITGSVGADAAWVVIQFQQHGADAVVVGGDQSGRVYLVAIGDGVTNWGGSTALTGADAVQAGVSAQVRNWSNAAFQSAYTDDVIFAATLNTSSTTNNKVFALGASNGGALWTFQDAVNGVDAIAGQPYVDYARNRIYVVSRAGIGGGQPSLWVIKTVTDGEGTKGQPMACPACTLANRHFETSPTLSYDGNTLYIGDTAGKLYAINAGALTLKWTLDLGGAPAKISTSGFVWEDYTTAGRLYFVTADGNVRCVKDNGQDLVEACTAPWAVTNVPGASTPLLLNKLFVGSSDGKVHQINLTTGADEKQFPAATTLDGTPLGAISTETGNEIFVGTSGGKIFKINLTSGALP